ncbi:hypothetical protein GAP32_481 [Cronobacter phage vB_CsaM_GAP32]|uniref:Uncharacterized protein n=1 Tax=Cronobacter phage vB_CsaM_GAP32 TaxID=1141136 RepID=K4FB92_9CAUD|nr:hypothetical protein GAP32_481 [Cronobacter phage vB_CsaM_GAP32]AFC21939.1 hypothetical protein GAP32_481 [Cronobacter phage vB_CsaM_GAP32]
MNQQEIVQNIKDKEVLVEEHRIRINDLYEQITSGLQHSGGVRTSEVDEKYKKIDAAFGAKAKLEGEVRNLKKELLGMLLDE